MDRPNSTLIQLRTLRFNFQARELIHFPPGKSSNILRGAFGTIFRRLACVKECESAATCEIRSTCPYAKLFEPSGALFSQPLFGQPLFSQPLSSKPLPSGLADWPRPFVFRAHHLDGATINAGSEFYFDLNLFDLKTPAEKYLSLTFAQLAQEGLGTGRKKVEMVNVESSLVTLPLALPLENQTAVTIRFLTPTELKTESQLASKPEFHVLASRIRDRISTLCELYGEGAPAIDYKAFGEDAALVQMTRCNVQLVKVKRRSTRTNQVHGIGGFVGEAEYEGALAEFMPWLKAAYWTGVGRQTVWGKGMIAIVR